MEEQEKLVFGIIIIGILFVIGSALYSDIEGYPILESFYYVVLSITTVGAFRAGPHTEQGLILTIILVMSGMGILLYVVSQIAQLMVEGRLREVLGTIRGEFAKMRKEKDHVVVCGYSKLGEYVCKSLEESDKKYVIIEDDQNKAKSLSEQGKPVLQGDPLEEEILKKSNIKEAEALVATLPEDADNIYLLMSAKEINPDLILAAKASDEKAVKRLHKVGAQAVVRPEVVGGEQLASTLLKLEEAGELETISKK